jgi:hypothetical protein
VAQRRPDIDGGMNKVFAAKIPDGSTGLSESEGPGLQTAAFARAPGTIPPTVNPPRATAALAAADEPTVAVTSAPATRVASAAPGQSDGFFSSLARKVGFGGGSSDTTATTTTPRAPAPVPAKPKVIEAKGGEPPRLATAAPTTAAPKAPDSKVVTAAAKPPLKPSVSDAAAAAPGAIAGSQPVVSANSFESRFSAVR